MIMPFKLTLTLCFTLFLSCKTTKPLSENYQIQCYKTSNESTYTVSISYQSNNDYTDIEIVKQNAIDGILFRGITGKNDCVAQKPLIDKAKSEVFNTEFYKQLYGNNKHYNKYVTNISKLNIETLETIKNKKLYQHSYLVTINKDLLKKDLINTGLLKQLNTGF